MGSLGSTPFLEGALNMKTRAMQGWQEDEAGPSPYSSSPPFCLALLSPHTQHFNVIFYDLAVGLPTIVFVAYLLTKVKGSVRKLVSSRSHIMSTYYGFLWIVCALNILRVLVQVRMGSQCSELDLEGLRTFWL